MRERTKSGDFCCHIYVMTVTVWGMKFAWLGLGKDHRDKICLLTLHTYVT